MAAIYTFKRVEKKYILNATKQKQFLKRILPYFHPDKNGSTTIFNIYFDNDSNELINTSIQKPVYKEKLRLRSYKEADDDTEVFLEIKKKFKGVVYKRRFSCKYSDMKIFLATSNLEHIKNKHTLQEIEYMIKHYNLKPKVHVNYHRQAYFSNADTGLRITFDNQIKSRYENLDLSPSDCDKKLLDDDIYIMEIKACGAIPLFLSQILAEEKIYTTSFSKVGNIHKQKYNGGNPLCFKAY